MKNQYFSPRRSHLAVLTCCLFLSVPSWADNAAAQSGNATGTRAFTGQVQNAFKTPYNPAWAAQGCTAEAWQELNLSYNASMAKYRAQANILDQRVLDAIVNPNQMNVKGFEFLGCDLSSSLGAIRDIANEISSIFGAISAGNIKDIATQRLEKMGRDMLRKVAQKAQEKACQMANKVIADKTAFIRENYADAQNVWNYANNFDKTVMNETNNALNRLSNQANGSNGAR